MGERFQLFRSRVGVAIVGAILVGGIAALFGAGTVWHPASLPIGGIAQNNGTASTQGTPAPTLTATPVATPTIRPTATPTTARTIVGSTLQGKAIRVTPGANSLVISSNGVRYTILVDQTTTYSGAATRLTDIQLGWHVSATITAQEGPGYLSHQIAASPDD